MFCHRHFSRGDNEVSGLSRISQSGRPTEGTHSHPCYHVVVQWKMREKIFKGDHGIGTEKGSVIINKLHKHSSRGSITHYYNYIINCIATRLSVANDSSHYSQDRGGAV